MSMSIYYATGPQGAALAAKRENICIIVDIFRASSTIVAALAAGYASIKAVTSLDHIATDTISAGECEGVKLPQATFDNSPINITAKPPLAQQLVLASTNGTQCILAAAKAPYLFIGCLLNASGVAAFASQLSTINSLDITIIQAGRHGVLETDDQLAAEFIAYCIDKSTGRGDIKEILHLLSNTRAAKYLIDSRRTDDVKFCLQVDKYTKIIPACSKYTLDSISPAAIIENICH